MTMQLENSNTKEMDQNNDNTAAASLCLLTFLLGFPSQKGSYRAFEGMQREFVISSFVLFEITQQAFIVLFHLHMYVYSYKWMHLCLPSLINLPVVVSNTKRKSCIFSTSGSSSSLFTFRSIKTKHSHGYSS